MPVDTPLVELRSHPENNNSTRPPVVVIVNVEPVTQGPKEPFVVEASGIIVDEELCSDGTKVSAPTELILIPVLVALVEKSICLPPVWTVILDVKVAAPLIDRSAFRERMPFRWLPSPKKAAAVMLDSLKRQPDDPCRVRLLPEAT